MLATMQGECLKSVMITLQKKMPQESMMEPFSISELFDEEDPKKLAIENADLEKNELSKNKDEKSEEKKQKIKNNKNIFEGKQAKGEASGQLMMLNEDKEAKNTVPDKYSLKNIPEIVEAEESTDIEKINFSKEKGEEKMNKQNEAEVKKQTEIKIGEAGVKKQTEIKIGEAGVKKQNEIKSSEAWVKKQNEIKSSEAGVKKQNEIKSSEAGDKKTIAEFDLSTVIGREPTELYYALKGGNRKVKITNYTGQRQAIKVKCSNNQRYRVNPVYSFLEAGAVKYVDVSCLPGRAAFDKLVFIYTPALPNEVNASSLFNKSRKYMTFEVPINVISDQ
ncbi:unnamed protein product [Thelazia callipaeda]|uniref:Major sperm protein n=1 Tax=Thelazia callipaeda TaxID=103827 RepID=A0A0N5D2Y2_THECL|nr:unnamed protein product [Thelazia callipaeda]